MILYVAKDGNYGNAIGMLTCDTHQWTEDDWTDLEMSPDSARVQTALDIASKYA